MLLRLNNGKLYSSDENGCLLEILVPFGELVKSVCLHPVDPGSLVLTGSGRVYLFARGDLVHLCFSETRVKRNKENHLVCQLLPSEECEIDPILCREIFVLRDGTITMFSILSTKDIVYIVNFGPGDSDPVTAGEIVTGRIQPVIPLLGLPRITGLSHSNDALGCLFAITGYLLLLHPGWMRQVLLGKQIRENCSVIQANMDLSYPVFTCKNVPMICFCYSCQGKKSFIYDDLELSKIWTGCRRTYVMLSKEGSLVYLFHGEVRRVNIPFQDVNINQRMKRVFLYKGGIFYYSGEEIIPIELSDAEPGEISAWNNSLLVKEISLF